MSTGVLPQQQTLLERWRDPEAWRLDLSLTLLIPAYNEAESITDTVVSAVTQTWPPDEVIVIDDGSTDGTGELARKAGARVIRPPRGTGSKAGAQTFGLDYVTTQLTMVLDADTTMAPDAIEQALIAFVEDPDTAAACGFVVPRRVRTLWERGRYVEYLFAFYFGKQIQDYFGRPMISSGCFSVYKTSWLRRIGGWPTRTLAEDMDVTWSLYRLGARVRFMPDAVSYPIEPDNFRLMLTQLKRWSHGFIQNMVLHGRHVMRIPFLRIILGIALWDAIFASLFYLVVVPLLVVFISPWALIGYVVDLPILLVPVIAAGHARGELGKAIASVPGFLILRIVNGASMLKALFMELVLRRRFDVYEKGH